MVEAALRDTGERFVANDLSLGPDDRLWLITGPNMGGKSTFLRQAALIAVLAQAGSFVPAARAKVGIVDRLFSRVGASDNLARGRSTFMVEMVETAAILAQASANSLVILDEIGRGTSTYDGLAIAWAVVEAMHDEVKCRTLFATHYHELTRLAGRLDCLSLHHVRAREWKGDLVLLHEVADGAADRSYGIAVAKLAGLPPAVVARARSVLAKLEAGRDATGGIAAGLDDLPLFAAAAEPEHATRSARRGARRDRTRQPQPARSAGAALSPEAGRSRARAMTSRHRPSAERSSTGARWPTASPVCARASRSAPKPPRSCAARWNMAARKSPSGWSRSRAMAAPPRRPPPSCTTSSSGSPTISSAAGCSTSRRPAWRSSGLAAPGAARWRRSATSTSCS